MCASNQHDAINKIKSKMNHYIENIISRRSVKKYQDKPVPMELIEEIVKAGTYAPSGMNRQSAIILAVTNKEMRNRISKINLDVVIKNRLQTTSGNSDPFYGAPVLLVVLGKKEVGTHVYDGALVMENMMLAANSLRLGSCWVHRAKESFETEEGKQILSDLGITEAYEGIGNCIIGYPAKDALRPQKTRKDHYVYWIK